MKIPCGECLCYVMCKTRLSNRFNTGSIAGLAWEEKCDRLGTFFALSDQDDINRARILFDLEPYK